MILPFCVCLSVCLEKKLEKKWEKSSSKTRETIASKETFSYFKTYASFSQISTSFNRKTKRERSGGNIKLLMIKVKWQCWRKKHFTSTEFSFFGSIFCLAKSSLAPPNRVSIPPNEWKHCDKAHIFLALMLSLRLLSLYRRHCFNEFLIAHPSFFLHFFFSSQFLSHFLHLFDKVRKNVACFANVPLFISENWKKIPAETN